MKKLFLFLGLILSSFMVNAGFVTNTFKHIGIENGLCNGFIKDIVQDKQGFLWFATESGLCRFDGKSFKKFKEGNSNILSDELNALLYDEKDDKLWIGTQRNGLSILDCSTQKINNYTIKEGLATNDIVQLAKASTEKIWITHYHLGIELYNKRTRKSFLFSNETIKNLKTPIWCSQSDGKSNLYLGHVIDGFSIIDLKTRKLKNFKNVSNNPYSLPGNTVFSICIDHYKNIWLGTNHGLALFNPKTERFISFRHKKGNSYSLISDVIQDIKELNDGTLWIATDNGGISILNLHNFMLVHPELMKFINISADNLDNTGLSSFNIRKLFQDSFGNIWIGTYGNGLDILSNSPSFNILPYRTQKNGKIKNKPIWSVCTDNKGKLYLGSENEIAVFYKNHFIKTINLSSYISKPKVRVISIKHNRKSMMWVGLSTEKTLKIDTDKNQIQKIGFNWGDLTDCGTFFEDFNGKMLIGNRWGVFSYANNKLQREEIIAKQLTDQNVTSIIRDNKGKLWVGTFGLGVFIFDRNDKLLVHHFDQNGFCSNAINQLYLDHNGSVWIATRKGLVHFKDCNHPKYFEVYNNKQGLIENHVCAIQEDKIGNIWVSTSNGISCLNICTKQFINYKYQNGIPITNFTPGSACSTNDGIIYFGSLDGACFFDPSDFIKGRTISPIQIVECEGLSKQIGSKNGEFPIQIINGSINLSHNQNSFRLSFSVPDYSQNGQVEYAYIMEGLENVWYNTKTENQVTFQNLPPGKYIFRVKGSLNGSVWNEVNIASLQIKIHPPFWLTWYAQFFYVAISMFLILVFIRFYKHKLFLKSSLEFERRENLSKLALNEERLRFYTNITHELRTPLTLILGPLEDLLSDIGLPILYKKKISIIQNSALSLLNLINQVLEFRKAETQNRKLTVCRGDLANLVTEIGLRYKEMNCNKKVDFCINIEEFKSFFIYFDSEIITIILNNLLSNAIKYTQEGRISLSLRSTEINNNTYIEIEVSDTGYGIEIDAIPHIFERYYQVKGKYQASGTGIGLSLVKSLTDLHEGIINVESKIEKGTSFRFYIRKNNVYPTALHKESEIEIKESVSKIEMIKNEEELESSQPVIVVVEDNKEICNYIASSLSFSYKVIKAYNGKEALEKAQKNIPDIIISDIMMPIMDGIEFCQAVKNDVRTSHIPVILLTAKDSIHDREEGYECGADSYLTKPFSAKLLLIRVNNLLESRKKLAQQIMAYTQDIKPDKKGIVGYLSKFDEEFLSHLTSIIEENIDAEKLDLTLITERLKISKPTLYRKLKALSGTSPSEFIRKIRLRHSLQLLLTGKYNISEVAYMSGYTNPRYFSDCFKEEYGMSPSKYLKQ